MTTLAPPTFTGDLREGRKYFLSRFIRYADAFNLTARQKVLYFGESMHGAAGKWFEEFLRGSKLCGQVRCFEATDGEQLVVETVPRDEEKAERLWQAILVAFHRVFYEGRRHAEVVCLEAEHRRQQPEESVDEYLDALERMTMATDLGWRQIITIAHRGLREEIREMVPLEPCESLEKLRFMALSIERRIKRLTRPRRSRRSTTRRRAGQGRRRGGGGEGGETGADGGGGGGGGGGNSNTNSNTNTHGGGNSNSNSNSNTGGGGGGGGAGSRPSGVGGSNAAGFAGAAWISNFPLYTSFPPPSATSTTASATAPAQGRRRRRRQQRQRRIESINVTFRPSINAIRERRGLYF